MLADFSIRMLQCYLFYDRESLFLRNASDLDIHEIAFEIFVRLVFSFVTCM